MARWHSAEREGGGPARKALLFGMATTAIKTTYSLDVETVAALDRMARERNVSKSEALRRAIRVAAETAGDADVDAKLTARRRTPRTSAAWSLRAARRSTIRIAWLVALATLAACNRRPATHDRIPANVVTAPAETPARFASTSLANGVLRARLPSGQITRSTPTGPVAPGTLVISLHELALGENTLTIEASDTGERTDAGFRTKIVERERGARCARSLDVVESPRSVSAPHGFEVVAFTPDQTCSVYEPPAVRLWVRMPDDALLWVELACAREGCLGSGTALVDAFVASFERGAPTASPPGPRACASVPETAVTFYVPAGYLVLPSDGEDYVTHELFRRQPMGPRTDSLLVSHLFSSSPNTLQQDYRRRDARTRMVAGVVGGRQTRLLEITRDGVTELIARLFYAAYQLDFQLSASSPESLAELRSLLERAQLPEDE